MGRRWGPGWIALGGLLCLGAIGANGARAQVPATAIVTATKSVTGTFEEGGTVTYAIELLNSGTAASGDNPGDELVDQLPPGLALTSASASTGVASADLALDRVTWNGVIAVGTVTITIDAVVQPGTEGDTIDNQGTVSFDADADAGSTNEATVQTDGDPVDPGAQPTSFEVAAIAPTVTIDQALSQPDPAPDEPVLFSVEFSEPVVGFDGTDVDLAGTAGATDAVVAGSGAAYTVAVSGATSPGTVIATIPAGAATDDDAVTSVASTSTDNEVTLSAIGTTTTSSSTSSTSSSVLATTSTTSAAVGDAALARTGSDEDGPLVAFLGYWLALGGIGALAVAGAHRRRMRSTRP